MLQAGYESQNATLKTWAKEIVVENSVKMSIGTILRLQKLKKNTHLKTLKTAICFLLG
jgi:hypothetical protein